MSKKAASHSERATPPTGVVYPLDWFNWLHDCTSLAELKVIGCVLGYDGVIGIESAHPTFSDLLEWTGLARASLTQGIKRAVERQIIYLAETANGHVYCPVSKSELHVHDHGLLNTIPDLNSSTETEHDHGAESELRRNLHQTLLTEFGMSQTSRTERIAQDIALTPKYPLARIQNQIRYTRYEIARGEDGEPARPIRNPAGRLIYRIRGNLPMPQGYTLLAALEAEGLTREQIYEGIYYGELELPEIAESVAYVAWLQNYKWPEEDGHES